MMFFDFVDKIDMIKRIAKTREKLQYAIQKNLLFQSKSQLCSSPASPFDGMAASGKMSYPFLMFSIRPAMRGPDGGSL